MLPGMLFQTWRGSDKSGRKLFIYQHQAGFSQCPEVEHEPSSILFMSSTADGAPYGAVPRCQRTCSQGWTT